jgi:hypothetical protein
MNATKTKNMYEAWDDSNQREENGVALEHMRHRNHTAGKV